MKRWWRHFSRRSRCYIMCFPPWILKIEYVFDVWYMSMYTTCCRRTIVITFNYVIFSNYNRCDVSVWCLCLCHCLVSVSVLRRVIESVLHRVGLYYLVALWFFGFQRSEYFYPSLLMNLLASMVISLFLLSNLIKEEYLFCFWSIVIHWQMNLVGAKWSRLELLPR